MATTSLTRKMRTTRLRLPADDAVSPWATSESVLKSSNGAARYSLRHRPPGLRWYPRNTAGTVRGPNFGICFNTGSGGRMSTNAPKGMRLPANCPALCRRFHGESPSLMVVFKEWQKCRVARGHHTGPRPLCSRAVRVPSRIMRMLRSATPLVGEL